MLPHRLRFLALHAPHSSRSHSPQPRTQGLGALPLPVPLQQPGNPTRSQVRVASTMPQYCSPLCAPLLPTSWGFGLRHASGLSVFFARCLLRARCDCRRRRFRTLFSHPPPPFPLRGPRPDGPTVTGNVYVHPGAKARHTRRTPLLQQPPLPSQPRTPTRRC